MLLFASLPLDTAEITAYVPGGVCVCVWMCVCVMLKVKLYACAIEAA